MLTILALVALYFGVGFLVLFLLSLNEKPPNSEVASFVVWLWPLTLLVLLFFSVELAAKKVAGIK